MSEGTNKAYKNMASQQIKNEVFKENVNIESGTDYQKTGNSNDYFSNVEKSKSNFFKDNIKQIVVVIAVIVVLIVLILLVG